MSYPARAEGLSKYDKLLVFHWSLSNSKSPQIFSPFLNIMVDLSNAGVWRVLTHPLISSSSSSLTKPLGTVPWMLIITGMTITFMLHNFISSLARSKYLSLYLFSLIFTLRSARMAKSTLQIVLFLFCLLSLVLVFRLELSDPREFFASHSPGWILTYALTIW